MNREVIYQDYTYNLSLIWKPKIKYPGISKLKSGKWVVECPKGEYDIDLGLTFLEYGYDWLNKESAVRISPLKERPDYKMGENREGYKSFELNLGEVQVDVDLIFLRLDVLAGEFPPSKFSSQLLISYFSDRQIKNHLLTVDLGELKRLDGKYILVLRRSHSGPTWYIDYDIPGDQSWKKRYLKEHVKP